jgi:hypothetical protein
MPVFLREVRGIDDGKVDFVEECEGQHFVYRESSTLGVFEPRDGPFEVVWRVQEDGDNYIVYVVVETLNSE